MIWQTIGNAFLIFIMRVTDVSLGTIRTTMIMRGQRNWAALIGFVEVTIWVLAVSRVITHLDTIWNIIGYSGGFAVGTLLGMWIESKLAMGFVHLNIVSLTKGTEIASLIRKQGYGATLLPAEGQSGPVNVIQIFAQRKQIQEIVKLTNQVDATAFVTIEDTRSIMRGFGRLAK